MLEREAGSTKKGIDSDTISTIELDQMMLEMTVLEQILSSRFLFNTIPNFVNDR